MSDMSILEMKRVLEKRTNEKAQLEGEYKGAMKEIKEKYGVDSIEELEELSNTKAAQLKDVQDDFEEKLATTQAMDVWN